MTTFSFCLSPRFHPENVQEFLSIKKTKSEGWKCDVSNPSVLLFFSYRVCLLWTLMKIWCVFLWNLRKHCKWWLHICSICWFKDWTLSVCTASGQINNTYLNSKMVRGSIFSCDQLLLLFKYISLQMISLECYEYFKNSICSPVNYTHQALTIKYPVLGRISQ